MTSNYEHAWNNEKVESLREKKKKEDTKKNQVKILEAKNTIIKILTVLNSRMERTEKGIHGLEKKTMEIAWSEQ